MWKIFDRKSKVEKGLEAEAHPTRQEMCEIHTDICGLVMDTGKLFDVTEQLAKQLDELKGAIDNQQKQIDQLWKLVRQGR